jgi:hypothetical protein
MMCRWGVWWTARDRIIRRWIGVLYDITSSGNLMFVDLDCFAHGYNPFVAFFANLSFFH